MLCHVWWARPGLVHLGLLSRAERSRLPGHHNPAQYVMGVALLRLLAGALLDVPPAGVRIERSCPDCDRPHGKPVIPGGPHVSVSHAGEWVVAVAAPAPVGVDVEVTADDGWSPGMDRHVFSPDEQGSPSAHRFFRYWTRKEAVIKATGRPVPMTTLSLSGLDGWVVADLLAEAGYAAAVAVRTPESVQFAVSQVA